VNWNVDAYRQTVFTQLGLELSGNERVLDAGCGDGSDADWFAHRAASTVGIDLSEHPRWSTLARPGLRFQSADAQALPFPAGAFDLVFMKDVLHHAQDPGRVLEEVGRVCAAGGRIYIVEGNRFNPVFYLHMTLMLGHQHFKRPVFRELVRRRFPHARFIHFEAHVYPFSAPALVRLTRSIERLIRVTPGLRRLSSYNAAIVTGG
jgi:ubiquinone/menaquinone biosynthesis C-methylase UbiE